MIVIPVSGIIASWEMSNESNVSPAGLRESLKAANGEDVRIDINSPGGDVFEGLEMYNLIKNYPGNTETRVVSMAASMGSIIALAGDKRTAEKTAAYMIHNAWGLAIGDYRDMREAADDMEAVTAHLSNIYTDRAGIDNAEVRKMMDRETWSYGEDLAGDFGFEIVDAEPSSSLMENRVNSKARYEAFVKAHSEHAAENRQALKEVAAALGRPKGKKSNSIQPAANAGKNKCKEINAMTVEELKSQNPDVYNAVFQAGMDAEYDRAKAHITMGNAAGAVDLAMKNIEDRAGFSDSVSAAYMAEGLKNRDINNRVDDDESLNNLGGDNDAGDDDTDDQSAYESKLKARRGRGGRK